ncbi:uncharacterized protein LOC123789670 [Ursus americanus]|uniref:uncharacterized protein LOC123789670 n=1 Tax=Ursus americanus TaxID=9643 RepID=UPI001E67B53A|nr:uncharacterized protein LOC123789670 [Ursus americanus]
MRAALPGVPATLPPPTPRACHFLPSPHLRPGLRDRCRWSGVGGEPGSGGSRCPGEGCPGPARSGSGSFGGGGGFCGAVPPVNCLRPRAARPPAKLHSAEGRREPPPPSPRAAEGRGELWRFRVSAGGDSLGARRARTPVPFAWSAEAAPGGARSRLPRQAVPAAARPAFLPSACPPARPRS